MRPLAWSLALFVVGAVLAGSLAGYPYESAAALERGIRRYALRGGAS